MIVLGPPHPPTRWEGRCEAAREVSLTHGRTATRHCIRQHESPLQPMMGRLPTLMEQKQLQQSVANLWILDAPQLLHLDLAQVRLRDSPPDCCARLPDLNMSARSAFQATLQLQYMDARPWFVCRQARGRCTSERRAGTCGF